jgi:hypothetical protein
MAGTIQADTLVLGDQATQSQNLVVRTNNDGTFTIERQSGEDLITIDAAGVVSAPTGMKFGAGGDTLSTYDEGTWTPTLTSVGGSGITTSGVYTRIGRLVHASVYITGTGLTMTNRASSATLPTSVGVMSVGSMMDGGTQAGNAYAFTDGKLYAAAAFTSTSQIWMSATYSI